MIVSRDNNTFRICDYKPEKRYQYQGPGVVIEVYKMLFATYDVHLILLTPVVVKCC